MLYTAETKSSDAGKLLSEPGENAVSFTRCASDYEDHSVKYTLKKKNFQRQYAQIYYQRLMTSRKQLEEAVTKKWGTYYCEP